MDTRFASWPVPLVFLTVVLWGAPAHAQTADVVTLANGDQITGEIKRLERGRLDVWTDVGGMLSLRWDLLASVVAPARLVEVLTSDGRRFLGTLGQAAGRQIAVVAPDSTTILAMSDAIQIFYIAIWAIATAILGIVAAIHLRKEIEGEFWLGLAGFASVAFGVLLMARPGAGALTVLWLIGSYAIAFGVILIVFAFRARAFVNRVSAAVKRPASAPTR